MGTAHEGHTAGEVLETWTRLTRWPGGGMVFNWLVGWQVPYAGSIGADIVELKYGQAVVGLEDRRKVRNHLSSVHAVALVNLGELTANLALMSMQPTSGRWIVTGVEAEYLKKARGRLTARCQVAPQDWSHNHEEEGQVSIVDSAQNEVTRLRVRWELGPKRSRH